METDAAHDVDNAPAKSETSLPVVFREPEWQLSKKELKKKELAELGQPHIYSNLCYI